MTQVAELIANVEFKPSFDVSHIAPPDELGFMQVIVDDVPADRRRLIGFSVPLAKGGGFNRDNTVHPITELSEVPEEARNIDTLGKGVGPHLHATNQVIGGMSERPPFIGVYTFDVNPDAILDWRPHQSNDITQIARQLGKIIKAQASGIESVVTSVHDEYSAKNGGKEIDAVHYALPPMPRYRQWRRNIENVAGIEPAYLIIRNRHIALTKIGEAAIPW